MIFQAVWFAIQAKLGYLRSSEEEFENLTSYLSPGAVAVDVGSNIGRYALAMSRLVGPSGLVVSIDPSTKMGWIQSFILFVCHSKNVKFFNCGLSRLSSTGNYLEDPAKPASAIFTTFTGSKCNTSVTKGDLSIISTLDELLSGIHSLSLIKLDAEGEEIAILQGALKTISSYKPIIIVENNDPDALMALLSAVGYEPRACNSKSRNIVFAPKI
jgi:FkbM family methyltransferase